MVKSPLPNDKNHHPPQDIYIGTSGIALPIAKENFPAEYKSATRLTYYSSLFNSLEVNSSFYKTPRAATFEKWANEVGDDFRFTIKFAKAVSHARKLEFNEDEISTFLSSAHLMGSKKGALLIQFPASISARYHAQVEKILTQIDPQQSGTPWNLAVEFRHLSWYTRETYALLKRFRVALVIHDMPGSATPWDHSATPFIYLRLHGPTGDYKGSYTKSRIQEMANWLGEQRKQGKIIYVYFNNTMGDAYNNARWLQECLANL